MTLVFKDVYIYMIYVSMEVAAGGQEIDSFQGTCFLIHNCWQKGTWIVDVESLEFQNSHATTGATFRELPLI